MQKSEYAIRHNARVKHYPDGHTEVCVASKNIFREPGWEESGWESRPKPVRGERVMTEEEAAANLSRSQRRAKLAIRDICLCTEFTHFGTFTLDPEKINRYSYEEVIERLNRWLGNMVSRKGFTYVFIPEFHKDGAIHFHGLFSGNVTLSPFAPSKLGKMRYNLPDWKFGHSLVECLTGSYEAAVNYCLKYITKNSQKVGGRWYLSGGVLKRPRVEFADLDIEQVEGEAIPVPNAGMQIKYWSDKGR